jgi:hypothetical protein
MWWRGVKGSGTDESRWRGGESKRCHGSKRTQAEESRHSCGVRKRRGLWVRVEP